MTPNERTLALDAMRNSRLHTLPKDLLVMIINEITILNRELYDDEMIECGAGVLSRKNLCKYGAMYVTICKCGNVIEDREDSLRCDYCHVDMCWPCVNKYCVIRAGSSLLPNYFHYCNACLQACTTCGQVGTPDMIDDEKICRRCINDRSQ